MTGDDMKPCVRVKLRTGFFQRTDFKLKIAPEGLAFKSVSKDGGDVFISVESIKSVTFFGSNLRMEVSTDTLTDAYFMNESDWLRSMTALKEKLGVKVICEFS